MARDRTPVDDALADVEAYIDDWFQSRLPFSFHRERRWVPSTDVYETDSAYTITMAVPGMRIDDISVRFERDTLSVRGVRREPCEVSRQYHQLEIPVGLFERRVRVTRPIDVDRIRVSYNDGLLRVDLPKGRPERIDVAIE